MARNRSRRASTGDGNRRPTGVSLVVGLGVVGVVLTWIVVLGLAGTAAGSLGFVIFLLSLAQLVVLVGLWRLRPWAWPVGVFLYALATLSALAGGDVLGLLVNLAIFVYLLSVRDAFRDDAPAASGASGVDSARRDAGTAADGRRSGASDGRS